MDWLCADESFVSNVFNISKFTGQPFFLKLQGPSSFLSHNGGVTTWIFKIKYHNDKYCNLNKSRAKNFGVSLGYTHLQHFMIWTGEIIFSISMSLAVSALISNSAALMLHIFSIKWHQWSIIVNNNLTLKIIEDFAQQFPVHTKRKKMEINELTYLNLGWLR